jgi:hypothetical protein
MTKKMLERLLINYIKLFLVLIVLLYAIDYVVPLVAAFD